MTLYANEDELSRTHFNGNIMTTADATEIVTITVKFWDEGDYVSGLVLMFNTLSCDVRDAADGVIHTSKCLIRIIRHCIPLRGTSWVDSYGYCTPLPPERLDLTTPDIFISSPEVCYLPISGTPKSAGNGKCYYFKSS